MGLRRGRSRSAARVAVCWRLWCTTTSRQPQTQRRSTSTASRARRLGTLPSRRPTQPHTCLGMASTQRLTRPVGGMRIATQETIPLHGASPREMICGEVRRNFSKIRAHWEFGCQAASITYTALGRTRRHVLGIHTPMLSPMPLSKRPRGTGSKTVRWRRPSGATSQTGM